MCYPCPRTVLLPLSPDRTIRPANLQMEPTRPTVLCDHVAAARGSFGTLARQGQEHARRDCGRCYRSVHEHLGTKSTDFELFAPDCRFTDDTVLAVPVAD